MAFVSDRVIAQRPKQRSEEVEAVKRCHQLFEEPPPRLSDSFLIWKMSKGMREQALGHLVLSGAGNAEVEDSLVALPMRR